MFSVVCQDFSSFEWLFVSHFLRELKNKATGVDILVPQYEHIPGPFGGSVDYHIIVVTQLFYFKTPTKHKESDIVQFMVSAKNYLTLLHPNTSMHILHTVLYTFPEVLTRRIC